MTSKGWLAAALLALMAGAWWWMLAPSTTMPLTARPTRGPALVADDFETPPAVALDRLRQLESAAVAPIATGRDPFDGRGSGATSDGSRMSPAAAGRALAASLLPPDQAPAASWPRLELIGLGERTADGTRERVAILAVERGVVHARAGDLVERVYRIERVGDDAVQLRLLPEDRTFTLALRP